VRLKVSKTPEEINRDAERKVMAALEKDEAIIANEMANLIAARGEWVRISIEIFGAEKPVKILTQPQLLRDLTKFQRDMREIHPSLVTGRLENVVLDEGQMAKFEEITLAFIHKATKLPLDWLKEEMSDIRVINAMIEGIFKISTEPASSENLSKFRDIK